jgi:hypothetical protein
MWWKDEPEAFLSLRNLRLVMHSSSVPAVAAPGHAAGDRDGRYRSVGRRVVCAATVVIMQVYRLTEAASGSIATATARACWRDFVRCRLWDGQRHGADALRLTRVRGDAGHVRRGARGVLARGERGWRSGRGRGG